jgi:lycopene cyclase domain-containing protein
VRHLTYLAVLVACLACALWLEPVLHIGVVRRWRRLVVTVLPVAAVFTGWDLLAIVAGQWSYDPGQLVGVTLPGRLPLEELLFFLVVPVCAILGFEAVRRVTGWSAGRGACSRRGRISAGRGACSRRGRISAGRGACSRRGRTSAGPGSS